MKQLRIIWSLILLVAILASLTGCGTKPTPTAIPGVTSEARSPGSVVGPTTAGPKTAPTAEPTPLPPQPPRVLERTPERGEELPPDGELVLRFDQDMNPAGVEQAFQLDPQVPGKLSWDNPRTLRFAPTGQGFQRDQTYQVRLDTSLQSAGKLGLKQPVEFNFRTVGFLEVTDRFPMPEDSDVATDSTIRVVFNRPVVPLTAASDQQNLPNPLEFTPAVEGTGRWVNTSIYTFEPKTTLLPGTQYTVRLTPGLEDTTGGVLEDDYAWSFTTQLPAVISTNPMPQGNIISPLAMVELGFNQPMNQEETESRFSLIATDSGAAVRGSLSWEENVMRFTPATPLKRAVTYRGVLEAGAPAASGEATIADPWTWEFQVAELPGVVSHTPRDGDTGVDLGRGIQIEFTCPISRETFLQGFTITPTMPIYDYWQEDDRIVNLAAYLKPSTRYTVSLSQDILGRWGESLTRPVSFSFVTAPYDPMVSLDVPGLVGTYNAYGEPSIRVHYRNVSRLNLALYALTPDDFVNLTKENSWQQVERFRPAENRLVRRWTQPVRAPLNELAVYETPLAGADAELSSGFYFLEVTAPELGQPTRHLFIVSDTNLTLKSTQTEALVWATDLRSGQPARGIALTAYNGGGTAVAQATTDADGVATLDIPEQDPWSPLIVLGQRGEGQVGVLRDWSQDISPWEFQINATPIQEKYRSFFYTERRIYRPSHTVYFKGILRLDDDGDYTLPPTGAQVQVIATDSQGREFWQASLPLSSAGTLYGQFELSEEAALGYYRIEAIYEDYYFGTGFQVAEYRKPEFQVGVTLDQDDYIQGDTIRAVAEANYFFGGPVSNATVTWRVLRQPYFFDRWQGEGYYSFSDYDPFEDSYGMTPFGALVTEGRGQTNAQGQFVVEIPADISEWLQSQTYTIEMSVADVNNQETSARSSAVVHKGAFYIGLSPLAYVGTAGQKQDVRAITVDTQGMTHTQQTLEVVFYQHEWYSVQEEADDGEFYWTNKVKDTPVATTTVKTDNLGIATASFTPPEGGVYKVVASGLDKDEHEVRSSTYLWVSDTEFVNWRRENNDRIELVADKELYRPGDIAKVLIPSPYQGETVALMTIERGHILEHKLLTLDSNSEQLNIPILPEYAPNVYVSVVIVQGMTADNPVASFKVGYVNLPVSAEQQELQVKVTPDQTTSYRPGDTVTYDIETLDYRGEGIAADLSVQVVDLAVEVLTGPDTNNILDVFYQQRGLGVWTATTLALSVDRHNLERSGEGKGGGGGGGMGDLVVREDLPDIAFWDPAVQTDANGHARIEVQLPDNLTTWRLTAQAVTPSTKVGKGTVDVITSLDVMVRPVIPRFMVIGDKPILGAVVHNNTDEDLSLTVALQAKGVQVRNATQQLNLPAHSREVVNWPAVVQAVEQATLQFSASAAGYSDAIRVDLPVYHLSTPETVGTAGVVEDQTIELVRLPEDADPSMGELTVLAEPSLAAGIREGLRYLEAYPYGCIEQTVSRFLPNVVTYRTLRELGIENPELETALPQQVGVGLQRIYTLQNLDGGWGWWPNESSNPVLSAYVVLGLVEAQRSGFTVNQNVMERSIEFLYQWMNQGMKIPEQQRDSLATILYTLAEADRGDLGRAVNLYENRAGMSLYAKAYLAMTLQLLDPEETSRLDTLVSEFADAAILSATGTHWEEETRDPWAMNTDTRTAAIVLRALVRLRPDNGLLPNAVRWLMTVRSSGRWETTQENVWAILALTDYMAATGELSADYQYSLVVNGAEQASADVTQENVDEAVQVQVPVSDLSQGEDNAILLERSDGPGKLYYSAFLRYFLPAQAIQALNRGIFVSREYYLGDDLENPVEQANVNDVITVKLTLIAPNDLYYLVFEDPLPAGAEAIDPRLQTTTVMAKKPEFVETDTVTQEYFWRRYMNWASHIELRDERVALFASYLPKGTYEYVYTFRATTPGEYQVMPATAYEMYFADVFGRSAGSLFTIQPND